MGISFYDFLDKKINQCHLMKTGKVDMKWQVDGAWYNLTAIGDCCSSSWFEHCDNGEALQDATLLEFDDNYNGDVEAASGKQEDGEYLQIDFLRFKTNKGYCTIEFRNSNNGYYSGWCEITKASGPPAPNTSTILGSF